MKTVKEEINRLVNSVDEARQYLFRLELERLVLLAQREQVKEDYEDTMKLLKTTTNQDITIPQNIVLNSSTMLD